MGAKSSESKEKFKTYKNVFDNHARRLLFELESKGHFDEIKSPISIGKEANIFSAKAGKGFVAVKIYRLQNANFNKMFDYIKFDPRYSFLSGKKRQTIFAWTQREYRNILKARDAGARVPIPIAFKDNIVVMEFIGKNNKPAPMLKDAPPENPEEFFDEIIDFVKKMYKKDLIHADLSHFNILNLNEKPVLIDFSQATTREHPDADKFLLRDLKNLCNFFKKLGVKCNPDNLFDEVKKNK